jgi:hypothetical protein
LQYGDDPEVEPGQTAMRVLFDWPGRSDGKGLDVAVPDAAAVRRMRRANAARANCITLRSAERGPYLSSSPSSRDRVTA